PGDLVAGPEGPVVVPGGDALVGQPGDLIGEHVAGRDIGELLAAGLVSLGPRIPVQEGGHRLTRDLVAGPEGPVVVPGGDALVGQPGALIGEYVAGRDIGELLAAGLVSLGPRIPPPERGPRLTGDLVAGPEGPVVVPGGDALVGQPCDLLVEGIGSGEVLEGRTRRRAEGRFAGVAVHEGRHGLPGDTAPGVEVAVGIAGGDALSGEPLDLVGEDVVAGDVAKDRAVLQR